VEKVDIDISPLAPTPIDIKFETPLDMNVFNLALLMVDVVFIE
jgi:hypothetical protein